jgi:Ribosomal protein S6
MINYETLMLVRSEVTDDELGVLERQLDKIAVGKKGQLTLFERWGKYKLAYPVKKEHYGVYVLARYEVADDQLDPFFAELDALFRIKYHELIMRHVTMKLPAAVASVYKRPEPVGSYSSNGNLDSFLKENKMEGLIDKPSKDEIGEDQEDA